MTEKKTDVKQEAKYATLFFLIAILLAYGIYNTGGEFLNINSPMVTVVSDSMEPTYHKGDLLILKNIPFNKIKVGDVIIFTVKGRNIPIVHRVINKTSSHVETKGDNNPGQLPFEKNITADQIKGKAIFKIPKVGWTRILLGKLLTRILAFFG